MGILVVLLVVLYAILIILPYLILKEKFNDLNNEICFLRGNIAELDVATIKLMKLAGELGYEWKKEVNYAQGWIKKEIKNESKSRRKTN